MGRMGFPDPGEMEAGQIETPKAVRLALPEHVRDRYLRGRCGVLATALQRHTGFPLWGMFEGEGGPMHHAFVRDPATGMALDVRGLMPIEQIPDGSSVGDPVFRAITRRDIQDAFGGFDRADVAEAGDRKSVV